MQSDNIYKRIRTFENKLYLEFGGKMYDDFHASRVLPGFMPDSKINMLYTLKDITEIILVIDSGTIKAGKRRRDYGITYDEDLVRLLNAFINSGLFVGGVVISKYNGQKVVEAFQNKILELGVRVYLHPPIAGYPENIDYVISEEGFGRNTFIETSRPLVVVTAPGPGSGKMATCLSQLYHESLNGNRAGYAKFETFPIWNLPVQHPINLAYEAATADLGDLNIEDPFHMSAYGISAVSYNRDIEVFPVLRKLLTKMFGYCPYKSPTDMGVNMAGMCISDDTVCQEASKNEIIRRYNDILDKNRPGVDKQRELQKIGYLIKRANIHMDSVDLLNI